MIAEGEGMGRILAGPPLVRQGRPRVMRDAARPQQYDWRSGQRRDFNFRLHCHGQASDPQDRKFLTNALQQALASALRGSCAGTVSPTMCCRGTSIHNDKEV